MGHSLRHKCKTRASSRLNEVPVVENGTKMETQRDILHARRLERHLRAPSYLRAFVARISAFSMSGKSEMSGFEMSLLFPTISESFRFWLSLFIMAGDWVC